jgi:hypothetical protein
MKKIVFLLPLLFVLLGSTSWSFADNEVDSLLLLLKTNEASAKKALLQAVTTSSFVVPNGKAVKNLPEKDRVAYVQTAGKHIKAYLASKEFVDAYNTFRETKKPKPPEEPKSTSQLKNEYRESLLKNIAELERNKTNVGKDQQVMLDGIIGQMQQQLGELDQANKTMYPPEMDMLLQQTYASQMEEHAKHLAAWEQAYPENNPKPMIKRWITAFLDASAEIDFGANTIEVKPGLIRFADQQYERKDKQWKLYFRAGKETVAAARTFAQAWLAELNH